MNTSCLEGIGLGNKVERKSASREDGSIFILGNTNTQLAGYTCRNSESCNISYYFILYYSPYSVKAVLFSLICFTH
jgi:hypothetical protein